MDYGRREAPEPSGGPTADRRDVVDVTEQGSGVVLAGAAAGRARAAGRVVAPGPTTQAARRQLVRSVTAEVPEPREGADRAARREALIHSLEMSRRRRRPVRR